jgi:cytosine/adenosine deaminase-related metal-dependent hydrolase
VDGALWCEWAWLGGESATASVLLSVAAGRIAEVSAGVAAPAGAVRLPGLTVPGLVNAHSHAFHRVLRGRAQGPGSFWSWRDGMYEAAERLDPERYRTLARAVYAEMALAGITAVGEFHYLHHDPSGRPYANPNAMGHALVAAAADAGIRITLLDTCYLAGGPGEAVRGVQRRFSDGSADAWAARVAALSTWDSRAAGTVGAGGPTADGGAGPVAGGASPSIAEEGVRALAVDSASLSTAERGARGPAADSASLSTADGGGGQAPGRADLSGVDGVMARVGVAVHSVRAVPPEAIATVAGFARERGVPLHVHVSEQPAENEAVVAAYGRSPAAVLAAAGALDERTTAVHGTHLGEADRRLLAEAGAGVCFCPTTEAELADGIGPAAALHGDGIPLSLGSDCHAVIDLLTEARRVELDQRLMTGRRGHFAAADLLRMAAGNGARALGWDAGAIRVGLLADLATIGLGSVRLAGVRPESLAAVLAAATAADVTHTIVGGEVVVADGRHTRIPNVAAALGAEIPA